MRDEGRKEDGWERGLRTYSEYEFDGNEGFAGLRCRVCPVRDGSQVAP
jgi:hypothetical protein